MSIGSTAQKQLRSYVERIERLEEEKQAAAGDIKEVYAEAKAMGFNAKILRKVVALRRKDPREREEEETILDLYMGALGMLPLFEAAEQRDMEMRESFTPSGPLLIEHDPEEPIVGSREIKLLEYKPINEPEAAVSSAEEKPKRKPARRKAKAKDRAAASKQPGRSKRTASRARKPKIDAKSPADLPERSGTADYRRHDDSGMGAPADA